jgi:hypothetical protein
MATPKQPKRKEQEAEFETFVGELLKVDPTGLSGKHRKPQDNRSRRSTRKKATPK